MIDKNYQTIIDIIKSVLNKTPLAIPEDTDIKAIYKLAKAHSLLSIVTSGLEPTDYFKNLSKDVQNAFTSHKMTSIRKSLGFDVERAQILQKMESAGIAYLPLKGILMNPLYPEPGMREFCDNDIYYDKKRQKDLVKIFTDRGYSIKSTNIGHDDCFIKEPFYNFEMHWLLIAKEKEGLSEMYKYYKMNLHNIMKKDPDNGYGYHMSDEDFYIYHVCHEYKHYTLSGCGLRFLVDTYWYNHVKPELDRAYIKCELDKMGLSWFEEDIRNLSDDLFRTEPTPLTEHQEKILDFILGSSTYGTLEHSVENKMNELGGSRAKYIYRRIWPGWNWTKMYHPFFAYTIIFIPILIIGRIFKALFLRRDKAFKELELSKKK